MTSWEEASAKVSSSSTMSFLRYADITLTFFMAADDKHVLVWCSFTTCLGWRKLTLTPSSGMTPEVGSIGLKQDLESGHCSWFDVAHVREWVVRQ